MRNRGQTHTSTGKGQDTDPRIPAPSASYRRKAWITFQKALDPLAPIKPLPPPRS